MALIEIPPSQLVTSPVSLFDERWLLLTAGRWEDGRYNTMTVSWGMLGVLWNRPVAQVFVRPTRHTHQFIETTSSFSLCAFPETYRKALQLLGSRSGRDGDKIKEAGLTPIASTTIEAPAFAEAELVIECQILYRDNLHAEKFLTPQIEQLYPRKDYHSLYIGEVLSARGESIYLKP